MEKRRRSSVGLVKGKKDIENNMTAVKICMVHLLKQLFPPLTVPSPPPPHPPTSKVVLNLQFYTYCVYIV